MVTSKRVDGDIKKKGSTEKGTKAFYVGYLIFLSNFWKMVKCFRKVQNKEKVINHL